MQISVSADYLMLNYGHHLIRWAMARIRAGTMTPEQFAQSQTTDAHPRDPRRNAIAKGIQDIMALDPGKLPESLR